jgi:hypothetical protein
MNWNETTGDRNEAAGDDDSNRLSTDHRHSRRTVLRAAGVGVGTALVGGALDTAAAGTAVEKCTSGATIDVAPTFTSHNNMWTTTDATQCIFLNDDDSYGWHWNRGSTVETGPNYPEVLCGTKPWGSCTGSSFFPKQRGDFTQLDLALSKTSNFDKTQGEWNLAEEWWLTDVQPECNVDNGGDITHEVMLVLEWSDAHSHGGTIEDGAIEDKFGNTIDYWAHYDEDDGMNWEFHIFRIQAKAVPDNVDLKSIMDYMSDNFSAVSPSHWVSGIEVGNEYWDNTSGSITWDRLDVTVNGSTETSGSGGGGGGNLLTNPGFEDGTTGWFSHASFSTVSSPVRSGSAAGEASNRTENWMGVRQTVTSQLSNNGQGTYDVSGFVRLGSGTGDARVTLLVEDDNGATYYTNTSTAVDDSSWTEVADSLNVSWSGLDNAELYFETDGSLADLYVDDASMTYEG